MSKPIDLEIARHIRDANETVSVETELEQLDALMRKEAEQVAKDDPTITLGGGTLEGLDSKAIYLRKEGRTIGLYAMGYAGPYSYTLTELDGTIKEITSNFQAIEVWGNEFDSEYNMIGNGSLRLHTLDIEEYAKAMEEEGWERFEAPK